MENGSFQNMGLEFTDSTLDFAEREERIARPAKENFHQVLDFIEIPRDLRKSGTIESLIQQNEDLMARLKVSMRRMSLLEDENRALVESSNEMERSNSVISDQMLVWKEKEKVWKARLDKSEDSLKQFQDRFPNYLHLEAQVERYQRYQEKIKSVVKPQIQKLKDQIQSQALETKNLQEIIEQRDSQIAIYANQLNFKKEELAQKIQFYEMNQLDLVSHFEKQKADLLKEIRDLNETNAALEMKSKALDIALEKQDELENTLISLRRLKDDQQRESETELLTLKDHVRELKQALVAKDLSHQDLSKTKSSLTEKLHAESSKRAELEEQLTSLRYMWSAQSEENKKLEISVASLEKLNSDLSSKMNNLRKNT